MTNEIKNLKIYFQTFEVGNLHRNPDDTLTFQYSKPWLENKNQFALAPALPRQEAPFNHRRTRAFFNNLIPEGKLLETLSMSKRIPTNPFQFLAEFGSDCAGALIILPENMPLPTEASKSKELEEITRDEIDKILSSAPSLLTGIISTKDAKFSLAGAQDKIAIIYRDEKIFLPNSQNPSTHILKPPVQIEHVTDSVFNEFFCMELARACGFSVPRTKILNGRHPLFLIERYDRNIKGTKIERLHQFDLCQAQGFPSEEKYEELGGPSIHSNYSCILETSNQSVRDLQIFLKWICFNLLIGNNDSHSKNLSFLRKDSEVCVAPLYDLLSISIYEFDKKFAFEIGQQRLWKKLGPKHFDICAKKLNLKSADIFKQIFSDLIKKISSQKDGIFKKITTDYGAFSIQADLNQEIEKRIEHFNKALDEKLKN